jgi:voltage-gated potassium channel
VTNPVKTLLLECSSQHAMVCENTRKLEVFVWVGFYRWLFLPSWNLAVYFSAGSYGTVGCSDVNLPLDWRSFGPLESIIGVLMCGTSVSVLLAMITRLIGRETQFAHK